jgi:streptogramin lyase
MGNYLLVSSYQDTNATAPKCRVFRVARASGVVSGYFDMPEPCKHAGGIADIGGGRIVLADTRQDWIVDLDPALRTGRAEGHTRGMIKLATGYGSAFTFFDGKDLWNGVWVSEKGEHADAKIYRVELGLFAKGNHTVTRENAVDVIRIPIQVQGAALDKQGNLWMTASQGETLSKLYRVDRKTGAVLAKYDMPPRIENISFDADGKLWAISESGAMKYQKDKQHFPVIFEIDTTKLK